MVQKLRYIIFLKDILILALTTIGGPHSHLPLILKRLVKFRQYLTEEELLELNALCQVLPGPASTQTITAIGYKLGGANLAYLTLLVWVFPSMIIMTMAAIGISYFSGRNLAMPFTKYLEPMAIGFVAYAAWVICSKVVQTKTAIVLLIISSVLGYFFRSPYITPLMILGGGLLTTYKYRYLPEDEVNITHIKWSSFVLFITVFVLTFIIGIVTKSIPVKLFESFYRNGSLIFGGGQVLIPLIHTEYVTLKHYLSSEEFLTGYALVSAIPGPIFAISAYIGALSMREYGILGEILGSILSTAGIFLPGTFLIFFVYRIWGELKKNRFIKAALEGINAVSSGLVVGVAIFLFDNLEHSSVNLILISLTFIALLSEKVPSIAIIAIGMLLGYVL
ncbi:MAG: chromate efflux transporter [Cytophagales bacterium]